MSPTSLDHARVWIAQGRTDLAEPALRRALAEDPDDPLAHALLGLCLVHLERVAEAVEQAREAIRSGPDDPIGHFALGVALLERGDLGAARKAIGEALRLAPEDAEAWAVLGSIELQDRRWAAALEAADRAVRLDAENLDAANVRVVALQQLGRGGEADSAIARALGQDPEDATTHVSAGWRWLSQGRPAEASRHFLEALRIEPDHEGARRGVLEALKARNRFYRSMLGWFLWMGRQSRSTVWVIVIGIFILPRALRSLARSNPALEPWLAPVIFLILLFVYLTWIIEPLFDASLFLHPLGRHALARGERRRALAVTICFAAGLLAGIVGLLWVPALAVAGLLLLSFVIPLAACLGVEGARRKRIAAWALAAMAVLAAVSVAGMTIGKWTGNDSWFAVTAPFLMVYAASVLVTSFVAVRWGLDPRTD